MHKLLAFLLAVALLLGEMAGAGAATPPPQGGGWAMIAPPVFHHLTPSDGLPYPVALGLAQDGHGFLWFATPGGVARWDGYQMKVFRHDPGSAGSLPEDIVTATATDAAGRVWFSTGSGVVFRFDEATETFVSYRNPDVSMGRSQGLVADGAAGMWVAGRQGLFHLDAASGRWRQADLPPGEVGSVLVDRSGRVWAGMAGAILRGGSGVAWTKVADVAEGDTVSALFEDGAGTLWFGTRRGRVGRLDGDTARAVADPRLGFPGHRVTTFAEPTPGVLWVGSYGDGLREVSLKTDGVRRIVRDPTSATSLGDNSVTGLLVDRSGMLWVSSLRGVHRHLPSNRRVMTIVPHRKSGLPDADVRAVAPAADGGLWLGFRFHGVAPLGAMPRARWPATLPEGPVQAIADPGDGSLWVGQPNGLSRIDLATGTVTPHAPLHQANVWALELEGETLWVGSSRGLTRLSLADDGLRSYRYDPKDPNSLSDDQVTALERDRDGHLWVGTYRGLNLLVEPDAGVFRRHLHAPGDATSLPGDVVTDIVQDHRGRLWASTSNGIGVLDPEASGPPRFDRVGRSERLRNGAVLSLVEAGDGSMVAGTGDGLAVIDPDSRVVRILESTEGVEVRTFWSGAADRLEDGTLALGAFGGLVIIRPAPLPEWSYRPPLVVTDVLIDDRRLPAGTDIVVGPSEDRVQVDFAALDYSNPGLNRYAYRLDTGPWVHLDALQRRAVFTNLPPGRHRLEIKGTGSSGLWSDPVRLSLRVLPEWHETVWFRLSGVAAFLLALFGLLHWRKLRHLRREAELNRLVEAKTVEAAQATRRALAGEEEARRALDVVEAAHRAKSRFLAVIAHEIRTPLNGILGMLQVLDGRHLDGASGDALRTALTAGENLRSLVESVLDYGRDGADLSAPVLEDVAVIELAAQVVDLLRPQAASRGLALSLEVAQGVPERIRADRPLLLRVLLNLLGNAIKFTERGGVHLSVTPHDTAQGPRLFLRIADTGIGVPEDLRDAIFGDFVQADDGITRRFGGVGLGLALSRRMATRMGGALVLEETSSRGSVFRLELPAVPAREPRPAPEAARPAPGGVPLRILVVDDDDINRYVAERLLRRLGHLPRFAASGRDALDLAEAGDVDVILMDLHMPEMDGVETTRRLRQAEAGAGRRRVPILAMTADLHHDLREAFLAAGGDGGLPKPIVLASLEAALTLPGRRTGVVDADALAEKVDVLGMAETLRIIRLFQRTSRQVLHEMAAAAAVGDGALVGALAHRLRSGAVTVGLIELADVAARVESAAPTTAPTASPPGLDDAVRTLYQVRRAGMASMIANLRRHRLDRRQRDDQARLMAPANR